VLLVQERAVQIAERVAIVDIAQHNGAWELVVARAFMFRLVG
jgi:hypothetical protein